MGKTALTETCSYSANCTITVIVYKDTKTLATLRNSQVYAYLMLYIRNKSFLRWLVPFCALPTSPHNTQQRHVSPLTVKKIYLSWLDNNKADQCSLEEYISQGTMLMPHTNLAISANIDFTNPQSAFVCAKRTLLSQTGFSSSPQR